MSNESNGWFPGLIPKTIANFFKKKPEHITPPEHYNVEPPKIKITECTSLKPAIISKHELDLATLLNPFVKTSLREFSGFWTRNRLMRSSITMFFYMEYGQMHSCEQIRAKFTAVAVPVRDALFRDNAYPKEGLAIPIYKLMLENKYLLMQHCILMCRDTGRTITLDMAARILNKKDWNEFALTKNRYTLLVNTKNK